MIVMTWGILQTEDARSSGSIGPKEETPPKVEKEDKKVGVDRTQMSCPLSFIVKVINIFMV